MHFTWKSTFFVVALSIACNASAGIYSDDLSRCLVESSSPRDKVTLVRWMFTSMALHPEVSAMSAVTPQQRDAANKDVAKLFLKLTTETCLAQTKKAIQFEGPVAIQQGFTVFGQVAGQELFSNPSVAQGLSGIEKHLDGEKLKAALGTQ